MICDQNSLTSKLKQEKSLETLLKSHYEDGLTPIFGYELEFYLPKNNPKDFENEFGLSLVPEKGLAQYEINSTPFDNIFDLLNSVDFVKRKLTEMQAELRPKPFKDDYGSSLHLHFNILNPDGSNLFEDKNVLTFAANGICYFMNETIFAILPDEEDYLRFDAKFMAPTHVSYGNNNRTVALRIPDQKPTRLEHRLCSPLCDVYMAIFIILKSSFLGIKNKYGDYQKIFGNAFDTQYNLEPLPRSLQKARLLFNPDFFGKL
jgi:glutamine synthetase